MAAGGHLHCSVLSVPAFVVHKLCGIVQDITVRVNKRSHDFLTLLGSYFLPLAMNKRFGNLDFTEVSDRLKSKMSPPVVKTPSRGILREK